MGLLSDIRMNFTRSEALYRLMAINIVFFIVLGLFKLVSFLSGFDGYTIEWIVDKLALKSNIGSSILQPWSIITYMFVHEGFMHILINMLIFYWTGRIFCDFLPGNKIAAVYLLGGITGGLAYVLSYNLFPAFSHLLAFSKLIGASAGVLAVLTAIATLLPDYQVHLLLFGPVKLKWIAIFLVVMYLISIPQSNAGGNIAHVGGAAFGFIYTKSLRAGTDIGKWVENIFRFFASVFRPAPKMKSVHRKPEGGFQSRTQRERYTQDQIDAILDKISRSGYSSLSKEEKEVLFNASKKGE